MREKNTKKHVARKGGTVKLKRVSGTGGTIENLYKVSPYLKGVKRLADESFDIYKLRIKYEALLMKFYKRGQLQFQPPTFDAYLQALVQTKTKINE